MDHECDLEGCYEVVPYNQYKIHQEKCNFRQVPCPGNLCTELVLICKIQEHVTTCASMRKYIYSGSEVIIGFTSKNIFNDESWKKAPVESNAEYFFLRAARTNECLELEVVMKGSQAECNEYTVDVSILHSTKKGCVKFFFLSPINRL